MTNNHSSYVFGNLIQSYETDFVVKIIDSQTCEVIKVIPYNSV